MQIVNRVYQLYKKMMEKWGLYVLAVLVSVLNISLAFDHVVWGDEAYSGMVIRNCTLYGVFERTYYWDSHPPLYYYYLRLFADVLGYETWVYHIASLVPFIACMVIFCLWFKKKFGAVVTSLLVLIMGLSQSCVEYNLEIRMYSLLFFFVLAAVCFAGNIVNGCDKKSTWVWMVVCSVLAAYTHYFGVIVCGLMLFFTGAFYYLKNRKKSYIRGLVSVVAYIVCYIPWLTVLYHQTQTELADSWMTAPERLGLVLRFVFGGDRMGNVILFTTIVMLIVIWINESGMLRFYQKEHAVTWSICKPQAKRFSKELVFILILLTTILVMLGFVYGVSYLFHPILAVRYTYAIMPLFLVIFILCMVRVTNYIDEVDCTCIESESSQTDFLRDQDEIKIRVSNHNVAKMLLQFFVLGMLCFVLLTGLLDFKYYRSVSKTQEYQTQRILGMIGEPTPDTIFCSNGVKHLAWSVLTYYYPDNEITMKNPDELDGSASNVWCFLGEELDKKAIKNMEQEGYTYEVWPQMWMGKYEVVLYHFYK